MLINGQGEAQLREVISVLDEKLRDLKKKYAEEMRRSLHIQSERIYLVLLIHINEGILT